MRSLIFIGRENERLQEGDALIMPGGEFEVTDDRADQLIADPHVEVCEAPDADLATQPDASDDDLTNQPAATGEGQDDIQPAQEA